MEQQAKLTWRWILGLIGLGMVLMALDPIAGVIIGRGTHAFSNVSFVVFALVACLAAFKLRLAPRYIVVGLMAAAVAFFVSRPFLGDIFYETVLQVLNSNTDPAQRIFFPDYEKLDPALNTCISCSNSGQGADVLEFFATIFFFGGILITGIGALFRLLGRSSAPAPASAVLVPASNAPAPASGVPAAVSDAPVPASAAPAPASGAPQPSGRSRGLGRLDRLDRRGIILWVLGGLIIMPSSLTLVILSELADVGTLEPDSSQLMWRLAAVLMVALGFAVFAGSVMVWCGCLLLIYGPSGSRRRRLILGILSLCQVFRQVRINKPVNALIHNLPMELVGIGLFVFLFHYLLLGILILGVGPFVATTTGDFTLLESFERYDDYPGWLRTIEDIGNLWPLFVVAGLGVWVLDKAGRIAFVASVLGGLLKPNNYTTGGGGSSSSSSSGSTGSTQFQAHQGMMNAIQQSKGGGKGSGSGGGKK